MWFTEEQIMTPELKKIKAHYLNPVEKEIYETLSEIMDNTEIDEFFFTNGNLKTLMERNKVKVSKGELTHIIKNKWKLQPVPNASGYTTYLYDKNGILAEFQLKGRYYSIRKKQLERIYVDLLL
jgi:DNA-binding transcriptional ArsR family regulator